jgi:hypothetical protein
VRQIRYSANQWNLSEDQRIETARTIEKQRKFSSAENRETSPALRRSIGGPG